MLLLSVVVDSLTQLIIILNITIEFNGTVRKRRDNEENQTASNEREIDGNPKAKELELLGVCTQ